MLKRNQHAGSVPRLRQDAPLLRVLGPGVEQQRAPAQQVFEARDGVGLCQRALRVQQAADLCGVVHLPSSKYITSCISHLWRASSVDQMASTIARKHVGGPKLKHGRTVATGRKNMLDL